MDRSIENPQIFLETNILGTQNLLDNTKKAWTVSKDENGYSVEEIAKRHGVSVSNVQKVAEQKGLRRKKDIKIS